jgi:methylated-DNA-protein-cysteine methyltransferase-like protein
VQKLSGLCSMDVMDENMYFPGKQTPNTVYDRVYEVVMQISYGTVASYGQVSMLVSGSTPRLVGYAMASVPADMGLPWHRVVNSRGRISPRGSGSGADEQRKMLEEEGVAFDEKGYIDFGLYGWL